MVFSQNVMKKNKNIYINKETHTNITNISNAFSLREIKSNSKIKRNVNIIFENKYMKLFILINLFYQILSIKKTNFLEINFSNITLKLKGIGQHQIMGDLRENYAFLKAYYPNYIYINGEIQNIVNYSYYFNQTDNLVQLVWNDAINFTKYMFYDCTNIIEIDLSNFDSSKVTDMYYMFANCRSLTSINFSNIKTSQVTSMGCLFWNCSSMTSFNLSDFDTSKVTSMASMFSGCSSLTYLNLSNFDTTKLSYMPSMFRNCSSLTSVDLSSFDTTQVTYMDNMFLGCSALTSLNLYNFYTPRLLYMSNMFAGCINLEYINMKNFDSFNLAISNDIFDGVPENIIVAVQGNMEKILNQLDDKKCFQRLWIDDWKSRQKLIIDGTRTCVDSCDNDTTYKYEYNGKCYKNCSNGFLTDESGNIINKCKCELGKCLSCSSVALLKDLCNKCNTNFFPMENDPSSIGEYFNCYKEINGYYLDERKKLFRKCYETCQTCEREGDQNNHNCLTCNSDYPKEKNVNNYKNCYNEIHQGGENDDNEKTITIETNQTKEKEQDNYTKDNDYYDYMLKKIETYFTSENYNTSKIDKGEDEIIEANLLSFSLTSIRNQKNIINMDKNETAVDLGPCEDILRKYYKISYNENLYIKKIDIHQEGMKIPRIEFDIYYHKTEKNLTKLNLSLCENSQIYISIPLIISENIDELNSSSGYYNDNCYIVTSESGTYIILNDRKNEFIEKNKTVCQEDCVFSEYDNSFKKVKCSCKGKVASLSFALMKLNKTKLFQNFKDIKNIANIKILPCYKQLFSKKGFIFNIGCFIIILIIIFHIICAILFYTKQLKILENKIDDIILGITNFELIKEQKDKENKKEAENNSKNDINIESKKKIKKKKKIEKSDVNNPENKDEEINDINLGNKEDKIESKIKKIKTKKRKIKSNLITENYNKDNETIKIEKIMELKDDEINVLSYESAIEYDKRSYCIYYLSLIKTKHNLIFSFFYNNDYNSQIIKINLFVIGFSIDYTVNGLFFNDDTMHEIYKSQGSFDFEYQLPQIIYSSLISLILGTLLKLLALSNDAILEFKQDKSGENINEKGMNLKKKLRIKFILYFIIGFIFLLFFWYYISMFGAIYRNTQYHLLKDTLISFAMSLVFPFGIYLLPGLFRIPALSAQKRIKKYFYNFSKILQIL